MGGGGGESTVLQARGCIQCTLTMANSLIMDYLPFANVVDNVILDRNRSQHMNRDIYNLPSSNNDVLNDIDPDINNRILSGLKTNAKVMIHQVN